MQTSEEQNDQSLFYKNSTTQSELLIIERAFNVPVQKLFAAFTTPEAIKAWWWPKGLYADEVLLHFHEEGKYFINMKGQALGGGGMTGLFKEIIPNQRLIMTDQFADAEGNPITAEQAKMPGHWPKMIFITFEFEATGDSKSAFTLSQQGIPNEQHEDCIKGWSESFDKLEKYLTVKKK